MKKTSSQRVLVSGFCVMLGSTFAKSNLRYAQSHLRFPDLNAVLLQYYYSIITIKQLHLEINRE